MIKYKVIGSFIDSENKPYEIKSEEFSNINPIEARKEAKNFFNNWKGLLIEDIKPTFKEQLKVKIENIEHQYTNHLGLKIVAIINEEENTIDYFGSFNNNLFDEIALGLNEEFQYYTNNNFEIYEKHEITYCHYEEFIEGYEDTAIETFNCLNTSVNFDNKSKPYWWLNRDEKNELVKSLIERYEEQKIAEGENHFTEFKPSLLFNFETKRPSLKVKYINAKALCAFLNSSGGTLFIGISDKEGIQGLEHSDFKLADFNRKEPLDYVRLEFDSLIRTFFESFVNHFIKADFKEIDSKKVFVVNVKPSNKPVFLKNKENDLVTKEFYIRKSASSEKIHDLEEIVDYCLIHFNG